MFNLFPHSYEPRQYARSCMYVADNCTCNVLALLPSEILLLSRCWNCSTPPVMTNIATLNHWSKSPVNYVHCTNSLLDLKAREIHKPTWSNREYFCVIKTSWMYVTSLHTRASSLSHQPLCCREVMPDVYPIETTKYFMKFYLLPLRSLLLGYCVQCCHKQTILLFTLHIWTSCASFMYCCY